MECSINGWNLSRNQLFDGLERIGIVGIHLEVTKNALERAATGYVYRQIDQLCHELLWMFEHEPSLKKASGYWAGWEIVNTTMRYWKQSIAENEWGFVTEDENQLALFDCIPRWALASKTRY